MRLVVEEMEEQIGRIFLAYGTPLMAVSSFRYLGRTLSSTNNYWSTEEQNLRRAQGKWGRLTKILGREGADKKTSGGFMWRWYKRCFCLSIICGL